MNHGPPIKLENVRAAKEAGLVYVTDDSPGITRKRQGKSFIYLDPRGRQIKERQTLDRIRMLAIPPAYRDVWICPSDRGHIQAVGRDDRGRKQYRYHEKWREVRDENKYGRMIDFAKALPGIRRTVARHMKLPGLPREKVLAAVIKFMEMTLIRVGNDEYAKQNNSYGLTTLQDRHARFSRGKVRLEFRGKSGVEHEFEIGDPRLAAIAKQCQDLPGQELFQYLDEKDVVRDIGSTDVNDYLRQISGKDFTAKDFRTWAGTVLAATALYEISKFDTNAQAKKNVVRAVESVAAKLGNTKAVCRKCYIHPEILNAYMEGVLVDTLAKRAARMAQSIAKLRPEEAAVLTLLQSRLAAAKRAKAVAPKTVKQALQRSLKLVAQSASQGGPARRRKAS
ncbi:MAG: topoisomerase [Phycisphaerales bacterium]|nr:topoisomerase [Phycisphaerales bacterium]